MRLYPKVTDVGQSFVGCKVHTVPNQNMTLREIIKRFIRKESLPVEQNGVYHENLGDLEKLSKADIYDQFERAADIRAKIDKADKRMKFKEAADNEAALAKPGTPPVGGEASEPTQGGKAPVSGAPLAAGGPQST